MAETFGELPLADRWYQGFVSGEQKVTSG